MAVRPYPPMTVPPRSTAPAVLPRGRVPSTTPSPSAGAPPAGPSPSISGRRICFVVNTDWFFLSHRLPVAEAGRARGAEVTVVAGDTGRSAEIEERGFRFLDLPISRAGANPFGDLRTLARLLRVYREVRPDLVHHVTLKPVIYGSLAARWTGVPAVVNAISGLGYVFTRARRRPLVQAVVGRLLRLALRDSRGILILQNSDDRDHFLRRGWIDASRVVLVRGSGVDCSRFRPEEEVPTPPYVVLFAGRMLWDKGVGEFVEAARRLRREWGQAVRPVLAGRDDPENPAAVSTELLRSWSEEGVVEWWGHREDMESVLAASHVVVLPSYREGLPKALLEGAAAGRALVATDVPGCREFVEDGVSGVLVPARDGVALAGAIQRLLRSPGTRRRLGAAARARVEAGFSVERVVEDTMLLYERQLGGRAG